MKTIISILLTLFLILIFPVMLLSGFMVLISETVATSSTCTAFLSLYYGVGFLLFKIRLGYKVLLKISISLFALSLLSTVISLSLIPSGETDAYGLKSHYSSKNKFCLITKLIREIDLVKFGSILVPLADEFIDEEKGAKLKDMIMDSYSEMQSDDDFVNVGSALNFAFLEILGEDFDSGHFYIYTPENKENEKLPVILFLHGSLGNFKVYTHVLKQFADKYNYAIVAPSFGEGYWDRDNGVDVIENARNYCVDDPALDESRIYLAGLSNGGLGVTRAAMEHPEYYSGLIYISAVLENDLISSNEFAKGLNDKPVLILHGNEDLRIPVEIVEEVVETLNERESNLKIEYFESEDHFLFLSKQDEVVELIYDWVVGIYLL